jgi:uncharacterized protein (TIGR02145 family)
LFLIFSCQNKETIITRQTIKAFFRGLRIQKLKIETMEEVEIGDQIWMTRNLNVDKFCNGDPIPEAKTDEEWKKAEKDREPAWCYNENDPGNGEKYGKLYNWYAVNDHRGLAPEGWYIPRENEWMTLVDHLGGEDEAGEKMKSTIGWVDEGNGTNESGFLGLPGGARYFLSFEETGGIAYWWSSEEEASHSAWCFCISSGSGDICSYNFDKYQGLSVRCLKE